MIRRIAIAALIPFAFILASTTPAAAAADWDPDDFRGKLDIRWIGATYTSSGDIHVSLSFYDRFRQRMLPKRSEGESRSYVGVWLSGALNGDFVREDGHIVFVWGDFGSTCCKTVEATRPSANVLSVTFNPCSYVYGEEIYKAVGLSVWRPHRVGAEDRTTELALSHPNC